MGAPPVVRGARFAGAAALIAVLTVLSRLAGFARTIVFSHSVGYTNLGSIYLSANIIPNIIFELVAGGALAALVVPLLAGPIARGDTEAVRRTSAALLTWVLIILIPLAVVVAIAAHPIVWLLKHDAPPQVLDAGTRMLRVFAPQLPLYGVGIVLTGVLQAHHRFAWPVLAPLLSSLTVIGTYLAFAMVEPAGVDIPHVGRVGEMVLAGGTTAGVVVLSLCLIWPVRRLHLRWRPRIVFDPEPRAKVRGLVAVGVLTVAAQQVSRAAVVVLVQWGTAKSAFVVFNQAQAIFLVPWAVLAVPVATSAYPLLAKASATADHARFQRTLASATRGVLLLSGLGAAALVALADPAAQLLTDVSQGSADVTVLSAAIAAFAPGLLGYGLYALYARALYARGHNRLAAYATLIGWGAVTLASVLLALAMPARLRVPAVTSGNSVGMLVLGAVLLRMVHRRIGGRALAGVGRSLTGSVCAGTVAALAGIAVRWPLPAPPGVMGAATRGMLSGMVTAAVFVGLGLLINRQDARPILATLTRRLHTGARRADPTDGAPDPVGQVPDVVRQPSDLVGRPSGPGVSDPARRHAPAGEEGNG